MKTKISCLIFAFVVLTQFTFAQQTITTTGGNASSTGGSSSFTIGQTVYSTNTGVTASEAQGVQQPYEISIVIGLEIAKSIDVSFIVYPNPSNKYVVLNIGDYESDKLHAQLFDATGKLIYKTDIKQQKTTIAMGKLSNGIYLLRVVDANKEIKTFRIVKSN